MTDYKEEIIKIIKKATNLKKEEIPIEVPPNPDLGDFAFPCFILSAKLKKNPAEIAGKLKDEIKVGGVISEVKATGPYLNFFLDKGDFSKDILLKVFKEKEDYGKGKKKNKKVMVEFFHANTHKGVHIGHVRNISLGSALARLLESNGFDAIRVNYQGDIGPHVAKCLWGYKHLGKKPPKEGKERWLGEIYALANKKEKQSKKVQEEIKELNKKIYAGDKEIMELWKKTRQWCLDDFKEIYKEFGVKYDRLYFESEVEKRGIEIAKSLEKKKIARESEGALIVDLNKYGLGIYVVLTGEGHAVYHTKDLALSELKAKEYKLDNSIHVVGKEQELYFKQLFKTFELIKSPLSGKSHHLIYELVMLPEGKMSSREGNVILYYDLVNKLMSEALKGVKDRHKDWGKKEIEKSAHEIAFGALKFSMLNKENNRVILFDWNKALDFEGDTGPYVQYTHARICSIFRRSNEKIDQNIDFKSLVEPSEQKLIKLLGDYPNLIQKSAEEMKVHSITFYLLDLSHTYNEFYHTCNILKEYDELKKARLFLSECVKQVLENGLEILGIKAPEQM
ncbi:MAG: arginine--tRNA ligase [Candidatus Woesearchaeota archaeon]